MVSEVWPSLRRSIEKETSQDWLEMASGRSLPQDEWRPALLVASRGPERSHHRHPSADAARSLGGIALLSKLLDATGRTPRVIVTDKVRSYAAAKQRILPTVEHLQGRYLNNRAENSHQPTRVRERQMKRFQSPEHAQSFLSIFESINAIFRTRRHLLSATRRRRQLTQAFNLWHKTTYGIAVS